MVRYLTKSDFALAQTCPTKLYYKKMDYPTSADEDDYLSYLAEGGYIIEKIAQCLYPTGQKISFTEGVDRAKRDTLVALQADMATLFQATFIKGFKLARVDIFDKTGPNTFELIEVKATLYDSNEPHIFRSKAGAIKSGWRPYLEDIAFQVAVVQEVFPKAVITPYLLLPDKAKITTIDQLHTQFVLEEIRHSKSGFTEKRVDFTGDLAELQDDCFLTRVDVSTEVDMLMSEVQETAASYVKSLQPDLQKVQQDISLHCKDCEYRVEVDQDRDGFRECWGVLADAKPHIFDMYRVGQIGSRNNPLANTLIKEQQAGLFDIPLDSLAKADGTVGAYNRRQRIQLENTRLNQEWCSGELAEVLAGFEYPLHFIDFETANPAVPYHAGMRPYEWVAFQWSCHTLIEPAGEPLHSEWLNTEPEFPNFRFAEALMAQIGDNGTVFMWATHERTTLQAIQGQFKIRDYQNPDLEDWLVTLTQPETLVDMNALTLKHFFSPTMKGKTGIKHVLEAVWQTNPTLRNRLPQYDVMAEDGSLLGPYQTLPPLTINGREFTVTEGTGAILAYQEMLYGSGRKDKTSQDKWKDLLLQYCNLDTLAMVMIWWHWQQITTNEA